MPSALFSISHHSMSPSNSGAPSPSSVSPFTDSRVLPPINTSNLSSPSRPYPYSNRASQPMPPDSYHYSTLPPMDPYCSLAHSNSSSIVSSAASTPPPNDSPSLSQQQQQQQQLEEHQQPARRSTRSTTCKKPSIPSLLSTPTDSLSSSDSSSASSPSVPWSAASSPTTTASGGTRSSSVATTPLSAYNNPAYGSDFDLLRRRSSLSTLGSPMCDVDPLTVHPAHHHHHHHHHQQQQQQQQKPSPDTINGSKRKARSSPRSGSNGGGNADEYDVLGRKKPKAPRTPMSWDPQDDILLKELKEEKRLGWKEIATNFPGRTSHACQFRWRRLASGTLKYYQGHRRPPVVTTTSSSFANEMASTASSACGSGSPKILMRNMNPLSPAPSSSTLLNTPPSVHHPMQQYSPLGDSSPLRTGFYPSWPSSSYQFSLCHPPLLSPRAHYIAEGHVCEPWSGGEDALLLDKKRSFDEVNVLLPKRSEREIWERMTHLRSQVGPEPMRRRTEERGAVRRENTWSA